MDLTGVQKKQFYGALLSAFPRPDELERVKEAPDLCLS